MKEELSNLLKIIWESFIKFANRLTMLFLSYGRFYCLFVAISVLIPSALHRYLGLSKDITTVMMKILLTITPILPTVIYVKMKEEDYSDEDYSMDLCFVVWIVTIVFAWWIM